MGIFQTKVDEKVDNSGWRIKIVAENILLIYKKKDILFIYKKKDVGIPTKLSDKSGCPVEPFFPAAESGP